MKKIAFISIVIIILIGISKLDMKEGFISKAELVKTFDDNYPVFLSVGEKLENKDGYYYAQYVDGKLDFDTNIEELVLDEKLKKDVEFIMSELKYVGVFKDEGRRIVYFDRVRSSGSQGIVYSTLGEPEVYRPEVTRDGWYYYLDNMNGM